MYLPDSGIENLTKLKSLKTFILREVSYIKVVETAEVLSKLPLLTKLYIRLGNESKTELSNEEMNRLSEAIKHSHFKKQLTHLRMRTLFFDILDGLTKQIHRTFVDHCENLKVLMIDGELC